VTDAQTSANLWHVAKIFIKNNDSSDCYCIETW